MSDKADRVVWIDDDRSGYFADKQIVPTGATPKQRRAVRLTKEAALDVVDEFAARAIHARVVRLLPPSPFFVCRLFVWWSPGREHQVLAASEHTKKTRGKLGRTIKIRDAARFVSREEAERACQKGKVGKEEWEVVRAPPVKFNYPPEKVRTDRATK